MSSAFTVTPMSNILELKPGETYEGYLLVACPDNSKDYKIFGESNIEEVAKKHNLEVISKIPIDPDISSLCDKGLIEAYNKDYIQKVVQRIESLK